MAENSKRNISDPKTTRLLKFFKYRNIESTEIILNGFPRKDRGYLIEGNKHQVTSVTQKNVPSAVVYYYCTWYVFLRDRRYVIADWAIYDAGA